MKKEKRKIVDQKKISEMILYISELSEGDERFGSTKLNKLLFFADFLAYKLYGKSISGESYEAMPEGPMLKGFYKVREKMVSKGEIAVRPKSYMGYPQQRPFALRSAEVNIFTAEELALIAHVVNEHREMTAAEISAKSHEFPGWQAVNMQEEIPYSTALISTRDLTIEEYELPGRLNLEIKSVTNLVPAGV